MVQYLTILLMGLAIGWLAGLSVSEVIATILTSLVGICAGLVTGLRSSGHVKENQKISIPAIDARPAAILIVAIALGATIGILARTHQLLEPDDAPRRIDKSTQGVLFNVTADQCSSLRTRARHPNQQAFRDLLAGSGTWGRLLERNVADTQVLKTIVEDLCAMD